jgi:hypothetical protein
VGGVNGTHCIFIDHSQSGDYLFYSMINGLSDHDAQLLITKNIYFQFYNHKISSIRNFNDQSLINFKIQLG